jgi:hypothetical protein
LVAFLFVTSLSTFLRCAWAATILLQLSIFGLLFAKRHYRTLPLFTSYIFLNLCQAALLMVVYPMVGFGSQTSFKMFWSSQAITMFAATLASTELLHRALWDYPGIWALAWRLIAVAATVVVVYSWATADKSSGWGVMSADRGYHLTFSVAIISCLLLVRYYAISIDPVYKSLLGGFCIYSCGVIVCDTLLKVQYLQHWKAYGDIWNNSEMLIFFAVLVVWTVALRHPVRALAQRPGPATPDQESYDQLSSNLNARLREINDVLRKFFRKEVTQP